MARGHSTATLLCCCALTFIVSRLITDLPGLPSPRSGFTRTNVKTTAIARRRTAEVVSRQQKQQELVQAVEKFADKEGKGDDDRVDPPHTEQEQGGIPPRPPIAPGDSGNTFFTNQPFQVLSWYPRIYLFPNFLDKERADHIVYLANQRLAPSSLALRRGEDAKSSRDVRTSQGTFLSRGSDPHGVLAWVEEKVAQLTGLPSAYGEPFNVLRYENGQHYDSHYDVFEPESYGPQASQRMATFLFYLSDVEEGGETIFPLEGRNGLDRLRNIDYRSCDQGYKYKPRLGDAVLFYSMHPNGTFDKHALHGGCPVVKGTKWVATKWIRDRCFSGCTF
eukprot:jgi/Botrbrau1/15525/Bobra.0123s0001.1